MHAQRRLRQELQKAGPAGARDLSEACQVDVGNRRYWSPYKTRAAWRGWTWCRPQQLQEVLGRERGGTAVFGENLVALQCSFSETPTPAAADVAHVVRDVAGWDSELRLAVGNVRY